jgi:hypothetical protein
LFGCEEPGEQDTWNCGEMTSSSSGSSSSEEKSQQQYPSGPVCSNGAKQSIIYAWAMDAPKLVLPKGKQKLQKPFSPLDFSLNFIFSQII